MNNNKGFKKYCPLNHQKGLTVIELMIALTLGLVLVAGFIQILLANRQTSQVQEAVARVQESGRVVMEYLAREIRAADYWGCAKDITNFTNHIDTTSAGYVATLNDYTNFQGISGTDDDGFNGSDSITLTSLFGDELPLVAQMSTGNDPIQVTPSNNLLSVGDIVFVSNCSGGDIFQITHGNPGDDGFVRRDANASPGNQAVNCAKTGASACAACLCQNYGREATLHTQLNRKTYFITQMVGDNEPALMMQDLTNPDPDTNTVPIASGIQNMQILYGQDLNDDGSANRYVDVDDAGLDLNDVVSVKISLSIASPDQSINKTYTTTVLVRNRITQ
ncbi:MAG: PilW family protein [Pseudomonadota bacterium]